MGDSLVNCICNTEATDWVICIIETIGSSCKQSNGESEGALEGASRNGILSVSYYYSRQIQDRDVSELFRSVLFWDWSRTEQILTGLCNHAYMFLWGSSWSHTNDKGWAWGYKLVKEVDDSIFHHVAQVPHGCLRTEDFSFTELLHRKTLVSHRPRFLNMIYSRFFSHYD